MTNLTFFLPKHMANQNKDYISQPPLLLVWSCDYDHTIELIELYVLTYEVWSRGDACSFWVVFLKARSLSSTVTFPSSLSLECRHAGRILDHKVEAGVENAKQEDGRSLGPQRFHAAIPALDLQHGLLCEREKKNIVF